MSLYHAANGVGQATFWILPMLGLHPDCYPRFRDCFTHDEEHPDRNNKIQVLMRTGGMNRLEYVNELAELREMPEYVEDSDELFDNTYMTMVFNVPEKWKKDYEELVTNENLANISDEYLDQICKVFPKIADQMRMMVAGVREAVAKQTSEETEKEPAQ